MADSHNRRVCVFRGSDGAFLRAFGMPHEHLPEDVTLTAAGELLVTGGDAEHQRCLVYREADGAYLRAFAAVAADVGSAGVAVGARGEVVVAYNDRVRVFE